MEASRRNWLPSRSIKSKRIRYSPAVRMPNSEKTNRHSSAIRLMVNDSKSEGALSTLTMPSTDWSNKSTLLQPTHHWILVLARVRYWRKGAFAVYKACLHTQLWHRNESAAKERAQQSQSVSVVFSWKDNIPLTHRCFVRAQARKWVVGQEASLELQRWSQGSAEMLLSHLLLLFAHHS